jgi:hypothetical protein
MMDELRIVVSQQQGIITTNFDEVKEALSSQMKVYKELEVTIENKKERKDDIATLRKIIKAVNDKRIEVKKECLKPYEAFEKQASELVDIINEPVKLIDNQVKEFEDKQRQEKINAIHQIYAELAGELNDYISIEQIYDSKWENVATSNKSIKEDITTKLNDIRNGITAIKAMQSEKTEEALNRYYDSLDLASVINFINRYEQQKREIEQRMKEQQEREREAALERERERIRREEREAYAREQRIAAEAEAKAKAEQEAKEQAERAAMSAKETTGNTDIVTYKIIATVEEFEMIEMYMNSIGVEFLKGDF